MSFKVTLSSLVSTGQSYHDLNWLTWKLINNSDQKNILIFSSLVENLSEGKKDILDS